MCQLSSQNFSRTCVVVVVVGVGVVDGDGIAMCKVTAVVNHTALLIESAKKIYKEALYLNC